MDDIIPRHWGIRPGEIKILIISDISPKNAERDMGITGSKYTFTRGRGKGEGPHNVGSSPIYIIVE